MNNVTTVVTDEDVWQAGQQELEFSLEGPGMHFSPVTRVQERVFKQQHLAEVLEPD